MVGLVTRLQIAENVRIQVDALSILQDSLGPVGSQDVIERAVVEVAERMSTIEQSLMIGDAQSLRRAARSLASIGAQLGLILLAKVADDAIYCSECQDDIALHAVISRLIRVGDASLAAAIEGAAIPG